MELRLIRKTPSDLEKMKDEDYESFDPSLNFIESPEMEEMERQHEGYHQYLLEYKEYKEYIDDEDEDEEEYF